MWYFYSLKCQDHRDKIYALLSRSGDINPDNPNTSIIRSDYSDGTTTTTLSKNLSVFYIGRDDFYIMLQVACSTQQTALLPSWCVNLDLNDYERTALLPSGHWFPRPNSKLTSRPFLLDEQSTLAVRGRVVDAIRAASRMRVTSHIAGEFVPQFLKFFQVVMDLCIVEPDTMIKKTAMLCRTLAPHDWEVSAYGVLTEYQYLTIALFQFVCSEILDFIKSRQGRDTLETDEFYPLVSQLDGTVATLSTLLPLGHGADTISDARQERHTAEQQFRNNAIVMRRSFCISEASRFCNVMH
ncbi:hypothetical protein BU23DRAFT_564611 [Bimuria novae-zelandiae CBS 107.79]|uniref:Uncharacterized protein n=1 Tax=Bimuria novae-zelandiae CBS 107.79 TaxID=1447943 RepID=A0A6A5VS80_9PLEO|nr:hypothetical protein BU23DRAFT_564611 [Bimuria novae-zelandiae CBS 107.79]